MGVLTPPPHEVRDMFRRLYAQQPQRATDWFYRFSQDTNYIRRDRIARDQRWTYEGKYGILYQSFKAYYPSRAVFEQVLEDAAVYRRTETDRQAFLRFTEYVNYRR